MDINRDARAACAKLLGRLDAGIRLPDCAPSLPDVREALENIVALVRDADRRLWERLWEKP